MLQASDPERSGNKQAEDYSGANQNRRTLEVHTLSSGSIAATVAGDIVPAYRPQKARQQNVGAVSFANFVQVL